MLLVWGGLLLEARGGALVTACLALSLKLVVLSSLKRLKPPVPKSGIVVLPFALLSPHEILNSTI